jgi:hypothetical protein
VPPCLADLLEILVKEGREQARNGMRIMSREVVGRPEAKAEEAENLGRDL